MCECGVGPLTPRDSEYERPIPTPRSHFRELGKAAKPHEVNLNDNEFNDVISKKLSMVSGDNLNYQYFRARFSIV